MTYVATDLSGSANTAPVAAPRTVRARAASDQPMIAANPALNRVNGGLRVGGGNKALLAGVGVAALLVLGGGTWYLSHRAAPAPAPVAAPVSALVTEPSATSAPPAAPQAAPAKPDVVSSPAASTYVSNDRTVTSAKVTHAKPAPIVSLRAPAGRTGADAVQATPAPGATNGLSANLAPQPQAVTPPVISPAPEAVQPAPTTSEAAPTTIQPAQSTVTPPATSPTTTDAPSAPQPQA